MKRSRDRNTVLFVSVERVYEKDMICIVFFFEGRKLSGLNFFFHI